MSFGNHSIWTLHTTRACRKENQKILSEGKSWPKFYTLTSFTFWPQCLPGIIRKHWSKEILPGIVLSKVGLSPMTNVFPILSWGTSPAMPFSSSIAVICSTDSAGTPVGNLLLRGNRRRYNSITIIDVEEWYLNPVGVVPKIIKSSLN